MVMLLAGLPSLGTDGQADVPVPFRMNGAIDILPSGAFEPVSGQDAPAISILEDGSFWTFFVDGAVYRSLEGGLTGNRAAPLTGNDQGVRTTYSFGRNGAIICDVHLFQDRGATAIVVTCENMGISNHTIGAAYAYVLPEGAVQISTRSKEEAFARYEAPAFETITISRFGKELGTVAFGDRWGGDGPTAVIVADHENLSRNWGYIPPDGVALEPDIALGLEWRGTEIVPGEVATFVHYYGRPTGEGRPPRADLDIERLDASPSSAYTSTPRTVTATVHNYESSNVDAIASFHVMRFGGQTGDPFSELVSIPAFGVVTISHRYMVWSALEEHLQLEVVPVSAVCMRPDDCFASTEISSRPLPYRVQVTFQDGSKFVPINVSSGEPVSIPIRVLNEGTAEDTYRITTSAVPKDWQVTLDGDDGGEGDITMTSGEGRNVTFVIKSDEGHLYERYPIYLIATSTSEGAASDHALVLLHFTDVEWGPGGNLVNVSGKEINVTQGFPDDDGDGKDDKDKGKKAWEFPTPTAFMCGMAALGALIFLGVILVVRALKRKPRSMKAILRELEKSLYAIDTDDEFRKAIFVAYAQMCDEFKLKGRGRGDAVTPKEFEEEMAEILPITKDSLERLTLLFEEARYSSHKFDEAARKAALGSLEAVLKELDQMEQMGVSDQGYIALREQKLRADLRTIQIRLRLLKDLSRIISTKVAEEAVRLSMLKDVTQEERRKIEERIAIFRLRKQGLDTQVKVLTEMEGYVRRLLGDIERGTMTPAARKAVSAVGKELEDLEKRIENAIRESEKVSKEAQQEEGMDMEGMELDEGKKVVDGPGKGK